MTIVRSRRLPGAVITDAEAAARQAVSIARDGRVRSAEGADVRVEADTLCLHGDTPGAVANARAVGQALRAAGIALKPLA